MPSALIVAWAGDIAQPGVTRTRDTYPARAEQWWGVRNNGENMLTTKTRSKILLASLVFGSACMATVGGKRMGISFSATSPPPERVEVVSVAPSPTHAWIAGHWSWSGSESVWISGRWERPEGSYHEWAAGKWEHDDRGWFWVEGHWR